MTRLCLDTFGYSNLSRGEPRVVAHLDAVHRMTRVGAVVL